MLTVNKQWLKFKFSKQLRHEASIVVANLVIHAYK